jgi:hypothetical protein
MVLFGPALTSCVNFAPNIKRPNWMPQEACPMRDTALVAAEYS